MGILSVAPVEKKIYKVDLINQNNTVTTITVSDDGLYIVYYIKEGKTVNRIGRITNIISNSSQPMKSYILFDMSDDNSSSKERIHFCQIQTIIDISENNAYKMALEHGFVGTLDDWFEYLKGPSGLNAYEMAIEKGYFEGTEEEWFAKYGEVGFVDKKKIDKVNDAKAGNLAAFNIDGSIYDSGIDSSNPTKVNVFIGYNSISNAVKSCIAKANDICIVKTPIDEAFKDIPSTELNDTMLLNVPVEYAAYVYDGKHWRAMKGNYNASNVYIGVDLASRYSIGNLKVEEEGELTTFETKNMSLLDFWNAVFVEKKEEPDASIDPVEDPKYTNVRIMTNIGSSIEVKGNVDPFILRTNAVEEITIMQIPLGTWTVTSEIVYEGTNNVTSKTVIVEDENVEYEVDLMRKTLEGPPDEVEI